MPILLRHTKSLQAVSYSGCIRNVDPVMCAHGALAFYLVHLFTLSHQPWPALGRHEEWNNWHLFGGESRGDVVGLVG